MVSSLQALNVLIVLVTILLIAWGGRRQVVAPVVTVTWVLHCILWFLMPIGIQFFLSEPIFNSVGPFSRPQLALLGTSTMLVLVICHIGIRRPLVAPVTRFFDEYAPNNTKLFWPTFVAFVALTVLERTLTSRIGTSFADISALAVTADNSQQAELGLLGTLETMLVGYPIAVISLGRRTGITRNTLVMAWCSVAVFCVFMIARGTRSTVFLPIVLALVALTALHGRARRRAAIGVAVGSIALIAVGAPVAAVMGVARGGSGSVSLQLVEEAYDVAIGSRSVNERAQLFAVEVNRKFDAIGPGVELLAMEPPGSAGVKPIVSASFSPIPRALYLTKPVPTSRDGTNLGVPYRVAAKAYGDVEAGMVVPVSAVAIAVWEFSGVGVLVFLIMNLFNLVLLNSIFMSRNVIARSLSASLLSLSTAEVFIAPPSHLVTTDLRLLLYLTALALASLGWRMLWPKNQSQQAAGVTTHPSFDSQSA